MAKWCTIVPINPFYRDKLKAIESPIDLGLGIVLKEIPKWFKGFQDDKDIGFIYQNIIKDADFCLLKEYEAKSLGDPDPNWKGEKPRSKQDIAVEGIYYANLALWLAKPSCISFRLIVDAQQTDSQWIHRRVIYPRNIVPNNAYMKESLQTNEFTAAKMLNEILSDIDEGPLKIAVTTLSSALREGYWDYRYILLWIVLEALFGPDDAREITHRLAQRLAFFLTTTKPEAINTYNVVKTCYKWRSKVVHGRKLTKLGDEESAQALLDSEILIQKALKKILVNADLRKIFNDKKREQYLESVAFSSLPDN